MLSHSCDSKTLEGANNFHNDDMGNSLGYGNNIKLVTSTKKNQIIRVQHYPKAKNSVLMQIKWNPFQCRFSGRLATASFIQK